MLLFGKKQKNIGFLGLALYSGNKGCEALAYSFFEILNEIGKRNNMCINAYMLVPCTIKEIIASVIIKKRMYLDLREKFKSFTFMHVKLEFMPYYKGGIILPNVKKLDFVFDFTAGDSFTDLYGEERFYARTAIKEKIIRYRVPLVLGSQTIGPFEDAAVKKRAVSVIKKSAEVFVRDINSYEYVKEISGRLSVMTLDIAFLLPYKKQMERLHASGIRIGFNPSGLLWNLEKMVNTKIKLSVDYHAYCSRVIEYLMSEKHYEVELIVHSYSLNTNVLDNDLTAVQKLKQQYSQLKVAPFFETSIDAKSYISSLDMFIGARMHATIAAYSSGVPVIPFSYSRKFEGLYESLEYPYVIQGTSMETDYAVNQTIEWIENHDQLVANRKQHEKVIKENKHEIIRQYEKIMMDGWKDV